MKSEFASFGAMNWQASQILDDIIANRMSIGFYDQRNEWNAGMIRTVECCGRNYCISEYAATLPDAVSKAIRAASALQCDCDGENAGAPDD